MEIVRCVSKHPFQGSAAESQLSFPAGEIIDYDGKNLQNQGWVWGTIVRTSQRGWCPVSYLAPNFLTAPAPSVPADDDGNDGFSVPIMGGTSAFLESASTTTTTTRSNGEPYHRRPSPPPKIANKIGSSIQNAGKKSWNAVSSGAQKVGAYGQKALKETRYRVDDMQQQRNNQVVENNNAATAPGSMLPRTRGEQRAADIGNAAARSAVVCGTVNLVCNPPGSLRSVARGIGCSAVFGGAREAVRDFKPFN